MAMLLIIIVALGISSISGFFFRMPTIRIEDHTEHTTTTVATTTKNSLEDKPIHIHHHYKIKNIHLPATTTASPWTWATWPSYTYPTKAPESWKYPEWDVKPAVEPVFELPENHWTPSWDWQTVTTETPFKWAYKRHANGLPSPRSSTQIKRTTMSPIVVTSSVESAPEKIISKRLLNNTVPQTETDPVEVTTEKPKNPVESKIVHEPSNILYKYMYKVNSPQTKDIKMHHEESDGTQITGHYSFVEADGTTRVVYYTAGKDGFNAQVKHFNWPTQNTTNSA